MMNDCKSAINILEGKPGGTGHPLSCTGYVSGYGDGYFMGRLLSEKGMTICLPDGLIVAQRIRVFLKFLEEHPERLHEHIGVLYTKAMVEAFPCPSGKPWERRAPK